MIDIQVLTSKDLHRRFIVKRSLPKYLTFKSFGAVNE